jgi:hypothetical protein
MGGCDLCLLCFEKGVFVGFRTKVEGPTIDDTCMNSIEFQCNDSLQYVSPGKNCAKIKVFLQKIEISLVTHNFPLSICSMLWSISSMFFARDFHPKFWRQKFQTQNTFFVQNFGANALLYEKRGHKTLMKLTPGLRVDKIVNY